MERVYGAACRLVCLFLGFRSVAARLAPRGQEAIGTVGYGKP